MTCKRIAGISLSLVFVIAGSLATRAVAEPEKKMAHDDHPAASKAQPSLDQIKKLEGEWVYADGDNKGEAAVRFTVGSGGNVVIENIFVGTPHEMVTVYHLDGDKVMMTHYCAAGNNPQMHAAPAVDGKLAFAFTGGSNMTAGGHGHMSAMTMTFVDDDHLTEEWTWKDADGNDSPSLFSFERVRN